jgi:hypothetical protein
MKDNGRTAKPVTRVLPGRNLTAGDITAEHVRVLGIVPVRTLQAVAAVFESKPGAAKCSALDVAGKLNVIEKITAVPYRTLREYSDRPGELGLLMGKGLADSRKATDTRAKQGSISFLKKRNKKLLLCWLKRPRRSSWAEISKSFLVLFFKKELLPLRLVAITIVTVLAAPALATWFGNSTRRRYRHWQSR